jgi:hypothetical protein
MENSVFPALLEKSGYFATFRGDAEYVSDVRSDAITGRLLTE